ncbi:MAG: hypothetical protein M1817_002189 [Caeruleum heppii]|nr:MAG: hypothetical protein M1817_002189 [Caeruleum heppii]
MPSYLDRTVNELSIGSSPTISETHLVDAHHKELPIPIASPSHHSSSIAEQPPHYKPVHTYQPANMSTYDYMFPAGMGHFSHPPPYEAVLPSSFPGYNSIQVPEVPEGHYQNPPSPYGRPMSATPAYGIPSPPPMQPTSAQDPELIRQRRQYHQNRRMSKARVRSHRTPSGYLSPHQSGADYGLGISVSPTRSMTSEPQSIPRTVPTMLEGYGEEREHTPSQAGSLDHYSDRSGTPGSTTYVDHYPGPEQGHLGLPPGMTMGPSHSMYQPSPLPSMSDMSEFGGQDRSYRSSTHGTPSGSPGAQEQVRVLGTRPKPQCWEHGCNGRQFSTFSNLLRHQREKSGTATKSYCHRCGAEFTRTTARNGHMAHDKCKSRRSS